MKKDWKNRNYLDGFNTAIEGIFEAIRTEVHMKFHVFITAVVIIITLFFDLTRYEIMAVSASVILVWITELFNTAIENCVDLACEDYHPLAKKAKDCASGAVLIASINAIIIGYLVFYRYISISLRFSFQSLKSSFQHQTVVIILIVFLSVIVIKSFSKKGTPLKGGLPSGHSALGGALFTLINFLSKNDKIFYLSLIMLILILQSRVEGKIHSIKEAILGAILGGGITYIILYIFNIL